MLLLLLLNALWASTFTIGKLILEYMPPILFVAVRMLAAGVILLGYQYLLRRDQWRFERKDWSFFAQITIFFMYIAFITEFLALQGVTAAKACLLFNSSPFFMALFAYFLLGDRLTFKQWAGLCIGMLGFVPIIMNQTAEEAFSFHFGFLSLPEMLLLLSVVTSTYGWILIKKLVVDRGYSSVMVMGVTMLGGGILSLATSLFIEGAPHLYISLYGEYGLSPEQYAVVMAAVYTALLVLIAHIVCFNLQSHLMKYYSVTFITFTGFTSPLFAALLDWIVFGIIAPAAFFITILLVILGLYLFYQDELSIN
ncbi:MAG TPA: DMT family transporter [Candidatus Babeliales bacterium]|nr:DMT family transporter [Candidatus Babeliales bacterium]